MTVGIRYGVGIACCLCNRDGSLLRFDQIAYYDANNQAYKNDIENKAWAVAQKEGFKKLLINNLDNHLCGNCYASIHEKKKAPKSKSTKSALKKK